MSNLNLGPKPADAALLLQGYDVPYRGSIPDPEGWYVEIGTHATFPVYYRTTDIPYMIWWDADNTRWVVTEVQTEPFDSAYGNLWTGPVTNTNLFREGTTTPFFNAATARTDQYPHWVPVCVGDWSIIPPSIVYISGAADTTINGPYKLTASDPATGNATWTHYNLLLGQADTTTPATITFTANGTRTFQVELKITASSKTWKSSGYWVPAKLPMILAGYAPSGATGVAVLYTNTIETQYPVLPVVGSSAAPAAVLGTYKFGGYWVLADGFVATYTTPYWTNGTYYLFRVQASSLLLPPFWKIALSSSAEANWWTLDYYTDDAKGSDYGPIGPYAPNNGANVPGQGLLTVTAP